MKIVLLGYMASGKSTIGKYLSARLFLPFIDLDDYIEQREEKSISEIFKDEGEIYFRNKEHQYLKELLEKKEDFILSLGGGTPCYGGNMDLIIQTKDVKSVYLQASIKTLQDRIEAQKNKRPLVANLSDNDLTEFIAKHLFERRYFYDKADFKIVIDDKEMTEIVAEIRILLH
ncbi:shikimate kinase [Tenacibaculum sp. IB213877]|uniref:shikimate kinase n=1 Tax=Tenacibaculum sp. IB213877 TaxID=3097351 RepID=UPI002A5B09B0|nr:shikimate kinase [Tenacibaculum sp. IB213877]MDY0779590.1 shikimate kinase [Tenacibaculum sp. IB213877]